jgi:hypothetical protein
LLTSGAGFTVTAQDKSKPNLNGVWVVNQSQSDTTNNPLEDSEISVTIEQTEPEIKMVRKYGSTSVTVQYFTDGREVSHKDTLGTQTIKSKTKWDGDKLVSRIVSRRMIASRFIDMDIVEEWKLSKDGKTLTKKVVIIAPKNAPDRVNAVPVAQPTQEFRKVYNRQS